MNGLQVLDQVVPDQQSLIVVRHHPQFQVRTITKLMLICKSTHVRSQLVLRISLCNNLMGVRTSLKNGDLRGRVQLCGCQIKQRVAWYLCQTPPAQRALVMSLLYLSDKFLLHKFFLLDLLRNHQLSVIEKFAWAQIV